mmetsp:Transcript_51559/g.115697  ORF Transcript_51559/g.115697 Transcript_51559/m.115697 type:complete len:209 (+) Transcript_51559:22-648(+)
MEKSVALAGPSSVSSPGRVSLSLSANDMLLTWSEEGVIRSSVDCLSRGFSSKLGFDSLEKVSKDVRLRAGATVSVGGATAANLEKGPERLREGVGVAWLTRPARDGTAGSLHDSSAISRVSALRSVSKTCRAAPGCEARVMAVCPSCRRLSGSARNSNNSSQAARSPSRTASMSKVSSVPGRAGWFGSASTSSNAFAGSKRPEEAGRL